MTEDVSYINNVLLPAVAKKMHVDAQDYGDNHRVLGVAGQYADMHRKMAKLKRAMWEGHELVREPLREVLFDMIGHSLLTIAMLDRMEAEKVYDGE